MASHRKDANTWQEHIEIFFESCKTTREYDDEPNEEEDDNDENNENAENAENDPAHPGSNPTSQKLVRYTILALMWLYSNSWYHRSSTALSIN